MEFKKLIAPHLVTWGDYELQDVIESLALFYDPYVMNICKERLLNNTDIASILNACLKTGNMNFLKSYSSLLHNKIIGDSCRESASAPNVAPSLKLNMFESHNDISAPTDKQYLKLLTNLIDAAGDKGEVMKVKLNTMFNMMYRDIVAGIMHDNIESYVTLLHDDADDKLAEVESIISGETDDSDDDEWRASRLTKLHSELEGNMNLLYPSVSRGYDIDFDAREYVDTVPVGFIHLTEMLNAMCHGCLDVSAMVCSIEDCAIHLDYTEGVLTAVPPKECVDTLKERIRVVRLWIANAMAIKNNWRSIMSDASKFNRVVGISKSSSGVEMKVTWRVHDYLVNTYTEILTLIPSIYGNVSYKSKLDIIKVMADAIDASMHTAIKRTTSIGGLIVEGIHTDDYLRGWSLENYGALHEATANAINNEINENL